MFCPAASQQKSTLLFTSFCELSHQRPQSSSASRFTAGAFGRQLSPANQLALLFVFGPVDLASGKAAIENVNRRGAAVHLDDALGYSESQLKVISRSTFDLPTVLNTPAAWRCCWRSAAL
jgi:hypothetical protein